MLYLQLDENYPELWRMTEVAALVRNDGLGVIPTDTTYAYVCDMRSKPAVERLYAIKKLNPKRPLSILCSDFSSLAKYTRGVSTSYFRAVRRCMPGPYTFILKASGEVPRLMLRKRREIGIRVPDDEVCQALLEELDGPLLCSSVRTEDDSYWNEPAKIADRHGKRLDFIVDGGIRLADPSTVLDLTDRTPELIREGKGSLEAFGAF